MDDRNLEPQIELPEELKPQKTELINGQAIKVGTLDEFILAVYGHKLKRADDGTPKLPKGVVLEIEKFVTAAGKFYRLRWFGHEVGWLAAEKTTPFRNRRLAAAAGYKLAALTGVFFVE
jgi:hypothetical protein